MGSEIFTDFNAKKNMFVNRARRLLESDFEQKTESFISLGLSNVVNVPLKPVRSSNTFFVKDLIERINVKPVVILGSPGAGKSTLLLKFALSLCDSDIIPVHIKFGIQRDYTDLFLEVNLPQFSPEQKRLLFEAGKLCLIFDGINESSVDINKVLVDIYQLSQAYPDCKFICSCRTLEFPSDKRQYYDSFEVLPVSDDQIKSQFIEHLDKVGEKYFSQLKSVRMTYLMDMCRIPLLLSMVTRLLYENISKIQGKDLYDIDFLISKSSIYQSFFTHIKTHQLSRQYNFDYEDLEDDLLYCIGYGMQKIGKVFVSELELKGLIRNLICSEDVNQESLSAFKQNSNTWYNEASTFVKQLPFFVANGTAARQISFLHQSFQEFFAGYFISQNHQRFFNDIRELIADPSKKHWESLEFASAAGNGNQIINLILEEAKVQKEQSLLILASKCILAKPFSKVQLSIIDNCCLFMIDAFKFWGKPYDYTLIYYSQRLLPYVSDNFPERLKRDAKWFSDKYGTDVSRIEYPMSFTIDMLINIARGAVIEDKLDAIYTMGKRDKMLPEDLYQAGDFLTELLDSGIDDIYVKEEVIKALKELRYYRAAVAMLKIINDKTEPSAFRAYALNAVANMKHIDAIDDIMSYMRDHDNPYRDSASWSLQKLALEAKSKGLLSKVDEIKTCYLECLLSEDDDLEGVFAKGNIVYSLSELEASEYLPQIVDWLSTQTDAYVIEDGLNAIIVLGEKKVQNIVEIYKTHPDLVVRQMAEKYFDDSKQTALHTPTEKQRRFRVALSFPGDYRDTIIEKIANGLANRFGEAAVLYDKFHEEEFGRPNLDIYLQKLYKDEADIIALFLCDKYEEKAWCGVESRIIRELMNQIKEDHRFILFRIDQGEVSGFYGSIDGFIDVTASDSDIQKAVSYIFNRYNRHFETSQQILKEAK